MYYYDPTYLLLIPAIIFAMVAQGMVKSAFSRYSRIRNAKNLTGAEAARRVLDSNGLSDVNITKVRGSMTDHYDPRKRILALSETVYDVNSVSAVCVACHEAGHALQHAGGYVPLKIRNGIVPVVNIASKLTWPMIIIGIILLSMRDTQMGTYGNMALNIGIIAFAAIVLFHLVTLPVEFNASNRALKQMEELNLVSQEDMVGSRKVLRAAAMTYVAALAVAIANLLRILAISRGRNN